MKKVDESVFLIDVRDVLRRMHEKSYFTLGEAFEDLFHDAFQLNEAETEVQYTGEWSFLPHDLG